MSHPEYKKDLQHMRQMLRQHEIFLQESQKHLDSRNEVQHTITTLSTNIETLKRKIFHSPQNAEITQKQLDADEATLRLLKAKKLELDRWLDTGEGVTTETVENERYEITQEILSSNPQQVAPYQAFKETREQLQVSKNILETLLTLGNDLTQYLNRIIEEGHSMRGGGVLRYIMGLNPNLVILSCFTAIKTNVQQALTHVDQAPLSADERSSLIAALIALSDRTLKKWSWRTIPKDFQGEKEAWETQLQVLHNALNQIKAEQNLNNQRFEVWLFEAE
ncbi:MAG: hypothetical protein Q8K75_07095 [Chlamydiales bacterium]|nr:hypothetical protein [Chlamydiales bacterium]